MEGQKQKDFLPLCAVALVMVLGNSMLVPVLPVLKKALGLGIVQVSLLITAFSVAAGLSIPVTGFLSDRYGRKTIIVPALILYGLAGAAAGFMPVLFKGAGALWPMLVMRAIQGVGAGGTYQVAMAYTGDLFQTKERRAALGYLEASNGSGKVIAPILGAALAMWFWTAPFYFYAVASLPVAAAVWFICSEPTGEKKRQSLSEYVTSCGIILKRNLGSISMCFLAGMLVLFLYFGVLAVLADELEARQNLQGVLLGLVVAIPVLAMAGTAFFSGRWFAMSDASTMRLAAAGGLVIAALGLTAAFITRQGPFLVGSIFVMGIGNGLVLPALNSLITSSAPLEERGLITSLYGTTRHIGAASGPPLFTWAFGKVGVTSFAIAAVTAVAIAVLEYFFIKERQMLERAQPKPSPKLKPA